MTETHIIINPIAGSDDGAGELPRRVAARVDGFVHVTAGPGDAERFARRSAESGARRIISVGGDGTLHEVVNGLTSVDKTPLPTLCIIPQGTGNDFCRTLNIPQELDAAIEVINAGHTEALDLVRIETPDQAPTVMVNAATGGFSDKVDDWVSSELKHRWGALAYLKAALEARHNIPEYDIVLELDGETLETSGCALVVANGAYAGGGMPLVPEASSNDGKLDVMLVQSSTTAERLRALTRFLFRKHPDDPAILMRRAESIVVRAEPVMRFNVDGEPKAQSPITFKVLRHALKVCVPVDR